MYAYLIFRYYYIMYMGHLRMMYYLDSCSQNTPRYSKYLWKPLLGSAASSSLGGKLNLYVASFGAKFSKSLVWKVKKIDNSEVVCRFLKLKKFKKWKESERYRPSPICHPIGLELAGDPTTMQGSSASVLVLFFFLGHTTQFGPTKSTEKMRKYPANDHGCQWQPWSTP